MADDAWGTSSGLVTDFSGEIIESHFGTDARYKNGEATLLFWTIKLPEDTTINTEDGTIEQMYGCGDGWFSYDGGDTIEHSGGKGKVNENAMYGKIITWALEQGLGDKLREIGSPLEAKVWLGLNLRFEETAFNYGGEIGTKKRPMPCEVLDADGMGSEVAGDSKDTLEGYGDTLTELAANSPDAEAFTESALALTGITDHASLVTRIADGSLFNELKD